MSVLKIFGTFFSFKNCRPSHQYEFILNKSLKNFVNMSVGLELVSLYNILALHSLSNAFIHDKQTIE